MSNIFSNDFEKAIKFLLKYEGVYSNNIADPGGETIYGISRNRYPDWKGWKLIDKYKQEYGSIFLDHLLKNEEISILIKEFYYNNYWKKLYLDNIVDYNIKEEIFEMSVNLGKRTTGYLVQKSVNILLFTSKTKICEELTVDGLIGPKTINAINSVVKHDNTSKYLLAYINAYQAYRYIKLLETNPNLRIFARGWIKRININFNEEDEE